MKRFDLTTASAKMRAIEIEIDRELFKQSSGLDSKYDAQLLVILSNMQSIIEVTLSSLRARLLKAEQELNEYEEKRNTPKED